MEKFRATHTSQGTPSNCRNRQVFTKGAQHGYSWMGWKGKERRKGRRKGRKEERKGSKKSLLSYKARIDGQPAPQKLTCHPVEPTGIRIWVFPTVKQNIKCTGISERECQTHSCLGVTVMKNDAEVLQSTQEFTEQRGSREGLRD